MTIALVKQLKEDNEDMKENVKNIFQECLEPVPCCEENIIEEDLGSEEEIKVKNVEILNSNGQVCLGKIMKWKKAEFQKKRTREIQERKTNRKNLRKNEGIKKQGETMGKNSKINKEKRKKVQQRSSEKKERIFYVHDSGSGGEPGLSHRKKTKTVSRKV